MDKKLKKIVLFIFGILLFAVFIDNMFQANRKTVSEKENRALATFPEFSIENLISGKFFSGIDNFVSDTFANREKLIELADTISFNNKLRQVKDNKEVEYIPVEKQVDQNKNIKQKINYGEDALNSDDGKLINGYIFYDGIPYPVAYCDKKKQEYYVKAIEEFADLFPNANVSLVPAPLSSLIIDNQAIQEELMDQNEVIDDFKDMCSERINVVNPSVSLFDHRDENIYFKYDHHWTQRGAYYAYKDFCDSKEMKSADISKLKEEVIARDWVGSTYHYTNDERIKDCSEDVIAYMPSKNHHMTYITTAGDVTVEDSCIDKKRFGYVAFLSGDKPFTVINVHGHFNNDVCLVVKDSFGNAFVPFLCENYSTIIVVDPRHVKFDIYDYLNAYPIKDIIFMSSITSAAESGYIDSVKRIVSQAKEKISLGKKQIIDTFERDYIGNLDHERYPFIKNDLKDEPSAVTPRVIDRHVTGKNMWQYWVSDISYKLLTGHKVIPSYWIENTSKKMAELDKLCESKNKKIYYVIIPRKEFVYPEYLPDDYLIMESDIDNINIFVKYARAFQNVKIIYALDTLLKAKKYIRTFFRVDGHWNKVGGYMATCELYELMGMPFKPLASCSLKDMSSFSAEKYDYALGYEGAGYLLGQDSGGEDIAYAKVTNCLSTSPLDKEVSIIGDSFRFWISNIMQLDFNRCNIIHRDTLKGEKVASALKNSDTIVVEIVNDNYFLLPDIIDCIKENLLL